MAIIMIKRIAGLLVRGVLPKFRLNGKPPIKKHSKLTVNLVTSWNTRCGIATYSELLANELKKTTRLRIVNVANQKIFGPNYFIRGFSLGRFNEIVHVQFAYGMFPGLKVGKKWDFTDFGALLFYFGLAFGKSQIVTTYHEVPIKKGVGGRVGTIYSMLVDKLICQLSDSIIALTPESRERMAMFYGVNSSKIRVIPLGCIENPEILDKNESKQELGLSKKFVITIPGFVSKNHGHDLAVAILPKLDENVHLLIAGGARTKETAVYYEELKKLAVDTHCSERITFIDNYPLTPAIFNSTDIALLPYRYATESLTLRHLVSYKIPTITSDVEVFRKIYEKYRCIELFKNNDQNDLLAKIKLLLSNDNQALQQNCQKMIDQNNWRVIATKHVQAYLDFLSNHPDYIYEDKKQRKRIDWLKNNSKGRSLEIGCAGGFITNYVGADVGLDLNYWRLRYAKAKYPQRDFVLASAFALPFKNSAFDTILIPETLEHIEFTQVRKIVSESMRIGNQILITLPNADKIDYDHDIVENIEHLWFPTKEKVLDLMNDCKIYYSDENDFMLVRWTEPTI